jgi:hypothetical protein
MVINSTTVNIYDVGKPGPRLRQAQKCGEVKPVSGIPPSPLDNWPWISNGNTYIERGSNKDLILIRLKIISNWLKSYNRNLHIYISIRFCILLTLIWWEILSPLEITTCQKVKL